MYKSLIDELLEELAAIGPGVNFEEGKKWGIGADSSWKFNLLPKKDDEELNKSCSWFAATNTTEERCAMYYTEGRKRCTYTCA